ncbi:MAG TPA: thiol-disulfide oxidoreductase DCC family protein [Pyrinomonadaceae bacterium]|nr:thiol-disulfide oxidoreductase DCC family protein [Pyrinomonadaceae bacterium]
MAAVVLFDGVCNFCDASVNFIIDHDKSGYFKFAPLQSEEGRRLGFEYGFESAAARSENPGGDLIPIDSVILVENGKAYTHSTGALRVVRRLGFPWSLIYAFIVVPRPIRDYFYRLFAKYRYRFFGKKDQCMIPTSEVRSRFLM